LLIEQLKSGSTAHCLVGVAVAAFVMGAGWLVILHDRISCRHAELVAEWEPCDVMSFDTPFA